MSRLIWAIALGLIAGCTAAKTPQETLAKMKASSCAGFEACMVEGGIAIIGEDKTAPALLRTAQTGARQFEQFFARKTPPIAIVPGGIVSPELGAKINAAGYDLILPWMSETDRQKFAAESVRKQVLEQTKGMPEAQQKAIIDMALSKIDASDSDSATPKQKGALTHELGHLWFMAAFENASLDRPVAGHGYGGWAPDWLDETAAILMENETLTQARREAFTKMTDDQLYPLRDYLAMEHPAAKTAKKLTQTYGGSDKDGSAGTGESRAIFLTGAEAEAFLGQAQDHDPVRFYTQTRGFIDFLTDQTNNPRLFGEIAAHLAGGDSFESWLVKRNDLPNELAELEILWRNWIISKRKN